MSKIFNYILLIGIVFASGFKFAEYVDSEQLNLRSVSKESQRTLVVG